MPRQHKHKLGARRYFDYSDETLQAAVHAVESGKMSSYKAEEIYGIPKRTIVNKVKGWHFKPFGKPTVLTFEEVEFIKLFTVCADFGYPLIELEIRLIIQQYLNSLNRKTTFKNNLPEKDWYMSFKSRHSDRITERVAQNIRRAKAKTSIEAIENYFNKLKKSIQGVSPKNILNFDETNFSDNSGN